MKKSSKKRIEAIVYPSLSAAIVLTAWYGLVSGGWVSAVVLPPPLTVLQAGLDEASSGRLSEHFMSSGLRLSLGYAIGGGLGVFLGLVLGISRLARHAIFPLVEVLRPIPPLAWIPLALIWFGIDEGSKLFLIALTSSLPVLMATMKGVQQIDVGLIRSARSMDVSPLQMLFSVVLPAAMPDVVTGLRLGWTLAITILVGAEMIAAPSGLGFMIMDGMNAGRFELVLLGILLLGFTSVVTDSLFAWLSGSRLLRWHSGIDKSAL